MRRVYGKLGRFSRKEMFLERQAEGVDAAMTDLVLGMVMLAAFALCLGAYALWKRTGEAKQPALMVLLAVIAVMNVLIWTVPNADGTAPIDKAVEAEGD